jgi:NADH-quinone oxidoreductase subunit E
MDIKNIINTIGNSKENIIAVLLKIQELKDEKYITPEEIKIISREMDIPESKIISILSFYTVISNEKRGKYIIQVCSTLSCYVNGSVNVLEEFKKELGIDINETTSDNLFTLEYTSCLGCCKISPAVRINGKVYGVTDTSMVKEIIASYRESGDINE